MNPSAKNRRSKRVPATRRLALTILNANQAELIREVVTTSELSEHGAKIRGKRKLKIDWSGMLVELHSGRQIPFRVAWQSTAPTPDGFLETGVEFLDNFDFWAHRFERLDPEPLQGDGPADSVSAGPLEHTAISPETILLELNRLASAAGETRGQFLEGVLSALVEQLEERKVFTRAELVSCLQKIGQL